jgi:hypothetical protein
MLCRVDIWQFPSAGKTEAKMKSSLKLIIQTFNGGLLYQIGFELSSPYYASTCSRFSQATLNWLETYPTLVHVVCTLSLSGGIAEMCSLVAVGC